MTRVARAISHFLRNTRFAIETSREMEPALMDAICLGERFLMFIHVVVRVTIPEPDLHLIYVFNHEKTPVEESLFSNLGSLHGP